MKRFLFNSLFLLLVLIPQFAVAYESKNVIFFLRPDGDKEIREADANLIWQTIQKAGKDDSVEALTLDGKRILSLKLGKKNVLEAKRERNAAQDNLRRWFTEPNTSEMNIAYGLKRGMERFNVMGSYSRNIMVMFSSGLHKDSSIDFTKGYPSDSFATGHPASPFSSVPQNQTGKEVEVIFVTRYEDFADSTFHRERIERFYMVLMRQRKAALTGFTDDHEIAFELIQRKGRTQKPVPPVENANGALILYKLDGKKPQYIEKQDQQTSSISTISSPDLMVSIMKMGVEYGTASLWVSIQDLQGNPVNGIKAEDFRIYETVNGQRRLIPPGKLKLHTKTEKQPMAVMLLRDTSPSMEDQDLLDSASAIESFLGLMGQEDMMAALVNFSGEIQMAHDFSRDRNAIMKAMDNHPLGMGTSLYDAIGFALEKLKGNPGYLGVVIAYTDGGDTTSSSTASDVIAAAKAASVPIFLIGLGGSLDEDALKPLAMESGGMYISASDSTALSRIYERLSGILKESLVLSYPTRAKKLQVDISLDQKGDKAKAAGS